MPNGWRTIKSLVHKIRLHGWRGERMTESFSREKLRHAPQKEGGWEILCDPPVWPRLVRPTNLISRMNGKKTHTPHSYSATLSALLPHILDRWYSISGTFTFRNAAVASRVSLELSTRMRPRPDSFDRSSAMSMPITLSSSPTTESSSRDVFCQAHVEGKQCTVTYQRMSEKYFRKLPRIAQELPYRGTAYVSYHKLYHFVTGWGGH